MIRPGAASVTFALLVIATPALAQPAAPPDAELRAAELFDLGMGLKAAGDLDGACAAFADSQALAPSPGAQLNLAACHERAGKLGEARALLRATIDEAERRGDAAPAARARLDLQALDAHAHARAAAAARARFTGATPVEATAAARAGVVAPLDRTPVQRARTPAHRAPARRSSRWTYVLGAGGALTVVGGGLLLSAHQRQALADQTCPVIGQPSCDAATAQFLNDSAVLRSRVGVGLLLGGVVLAETALYLWWRDRERRPARQPGFVVAPGGGMVTFEGSWR